LRREFFTHVYSSGHNGKQHKNVKFPAAALNFNPPPPPHVIFVSFIELFKNLNFRTTLLFSHALFRRDLSRREFFILGRYRKAGFRRLEGAERLAFRDIKMEEDDEKRIFSLLSRVRPGRYAALCRRGAG
jgi:hypothetical protein